MKIRNFVIVGLLALAFVLSPVVTNAQTVEDLQRQIAALMEQIRLLQGQSGSGNQWCFTFDRNLGVGASGRDVRELNIALAREGFPVTSDRLTSNTVEPRQISDDGEDNEEGNEEDRNDGRKSRNENNRTDRYTEATAAAVSQFQLKYKDEILTASGLNAPTGYFGPASRRKMNSLYGCLRTKPSTSGPSIKVITPNGGEVWDTGSNQRVVWTGGRPNWKVNIFVVDTRSDSYYLSNSPILIYNTDNDGNELVYIPSNLESGTDYKVRIACQDGCTSFVPGDVPTDDSNGTFRIRGLNQSGNRPPSISGVSGPTTLAVNEQGTWTVQASDPENGQLSYSVVWGDEYSATAAASPASGGVQQTATFTHTYSRAGSFSPAFTVTDNTGQSARTSLSVVVGGVQSPQGTLNVSLDASTSVSANLTAGQTNVAFAKIKVTAGATSVNNMNGIQIGSDSVNASSFLTNFRVYDGSTLLASSNADLAFNGSYYYQWLNVSGFSVPAYNSKLLLVIADVKPTAPAGSVRLGIAGWNFDPPGANVVPFGTPIYGNMMFIGTSTPQPTPTIISSNPPNGAVNAVDYGSDLTHFGGVSLTFSRPLSGSAEVLGDLLITSSNGSTLTPVDYGLSNPSTVDFLFRRNNLFTNLAGERILITHRPSNSSICLGFLPGDADQNGFANSLDVSYLNGVLAGTITNQPLYRTDINRDGVVNQSDITKINEIISSTPITARRLPACPSASL